MFFVTFRPRVRCCPFDLREYRVRNVDSEINASRNSDGKHSTDLDCTPYRKTNPGFVVRLMERTFDAFNWEQILPLRFDVNQAFGILTVTCDNQYNEIPLPWQRNLSFSIYARMCNLYRLTMYIYHL